LSVVVGGKLNTASALYANILGGQSNTACANYATVVSGLSNTSQATSAVILGGDCNCAQNNYAGIYGCGITSALDCAWHVNRLVIANVPTSSVGLPAGAVWSNGGVLNIV
jgi:hypothetical protein